MNKYLQKLHSLERQSRTPNLETPHPHQLSKLTEPGFDSFDSSQGLPFSEKSRSALGEETAQAMQQRMAKNEKTGILGNRQNCQNLPYGHVLDALKSRCPAYVPPERWRQTVADSETFVAQWGQQARALEWTAHDLWNLHKPPPNPAPNYSRTARYDEAGLLWVLGGNSVTALSSETAVIRSATGNILKFRKHNRPAVGPLGDSLEELK
jgi:hypothetical protein